MWMRHELNKFNFLNIKRVPVIKSQFFKRLHFGGPTLEVPRWSHLISFWPSDNFLNWDQINVMIPNYRTDLTLKPFNQWSSMKTNSGITYFGFTLGLFSDNQISIGADCSFNLFNIMSDTSNSNLALLPHQRYYCPSYSRKSGVFYRALPKHPCHCCAPFPWQGLRRLEVPTAKRSSRVASLVNWSSQT